MFSRKYVYVAIFATMTVKSLANVSDTRTSSSDKSSFTVATKNKFSPSLKLINTEKTLSSNDNANDKNDVPRTDRSITRKLGVGRRELIIYQYNDEQLRRNWRVSKIPVLRSRLRDRRRGKVRPIARNGGVARGRIRKHRTKEKVINKTAKVLFYKEYDDNGNLVNNVTMRTLDDVANFFFTYLDVLLCYDECEGVIFPTHTTATAQSVSEKNVYYEVKEYYGNGSYSVVESSTKWMWL